MPQDPPKKGWLAAFIDRRLTAPADASRVALKGLPQNSYPTIGPTTIRNGKPVSLAIKPDAYGDMRDIVTEGNGLLDILPGVGEIRGLAQGKQLADEGHPLLGAAIGAVSALPGGSAVAKKLAGEAGEKIVAAAVRTAGKSPQIFQGLNHGLATSAAREAGVARSSRLLDGFVTNTGRFVNRREAMTLARASGQAKTSVNGGLISQIVKPPELPTNDILERAAAGGFTFDPRLGRFVEHGGVMVGGVPGQKGMVVAAGDDVAKALEKFRAANAELLSQDGMMMGGWFDKDSNKFFFDVAQKVPREEAPALLKARGEKAGWDLDKGEELVNPHATEAVSAGSEPPKVGPGDLGPDGKYTMPMSEAAAGRNDPIVAAAVRSPRSGQVYQGITHADAIDQIKEAEGKHVADAVAKSDSWHDLFVTKSGATINRRALADEWGGRRPISEMMKLPGLLDEAAPPEKITAAAIQLEDGRVVTGVNHADAVEKAGNPKSYYDGFQTSAGRFVDRQQAHEIATGERGGSEHLTAQQLEAPGLLGMDSESGNTIPLDVSTDPAGVDASRPPLYRPPRADLSVLDPIKRRIRSVYTPAAERGLKEGGLGPAWYDLSPLRKIFEQESPTGAQDFKMFTALMGPTSAGTDVPMNIRQASLFYKLWKEGKLTPEALASKSLEIPPGYGNRLNIRGPLTRVVENSQLDPLATPKTFRYSDQLGGSSWGGTALDRHVGYNIGLLGEHVGSDINTAGSGMRGFPTGGYAKTKQISTSPQDTHYAAIEDAMVREAEKLGVHPAVYQAAGWVGNAAKTGVEDARHPLEIINEKLGATAKKYGYKSRTAALRAFIRGETPLWALGGLGAYGLLNADEQPAGGLLGEQ